MKIIQNVFGERLITREVKKLTLRVIPSSQKAHSIRVERVR